MRNNLALKLKTLETLDESKAEVVFFDLDETILDGTVINLSDEELVAAGLLNGVMQIINQAISLQIPVVMVTRNSDELIKRFFIAKPRLHSLFDRTIACETGKKSFAVNRCLIDMGIDPKKALFIDDTASERSDVERNTDGVRVSDPNDTNVIDLSKLEIETAKSSRGKLIEWLERIPYADERRRKEKEIKSIFNVVEIDQIKLAA